MSIDCTKYPSMIELCLKITERVDNVEKIADDVQTQVWIVSGVCGGATLILVIVLIAVAILLSSLRKKAIFLTGNAKPKPTPEFASPTKNTLNRGGESSTQQIRQQPPPHSFAQAPNNLTSEEELAQLGFSAYTGHPVDSSRGLSTSPAVNSGGVRVLPRNPHSGFRNNGGAYNDGYM